MLRNIHPFFVVLVFGLMALLCIVVANDIYLSIYQAKPAAVLRRSGFDQDGNLCGSGYDYGIHSKEINYQEVNNRDIRWQI